MIIIKKYRPLERGIKITYNPIILQIKSFVFQGLRSYQINSDVYSKYFKYLSKFCLSFRDFCE